MHPAPQEIRTYFRVYWKLDVWQRSYDSRRILDAADFAERTRYIRENPVRAHIATHADGYLFSSAGRGHLVDPHPLLRRE